MATLKPEANLWKKLRGKLPPHWNTTRIENRVGAGVPDVHICAEGVPFWLELKTTKTSRINISSHQVAWNFAYAKAGGVSFYLVHPLLSPNLYLFDGILGRELLDHGLRTGQSGSVTAAPCLWSGSDWSGLAVGMLEAARGRVGVGSGSGHRGPRLGAAGSGAFVKL